MAKSPIKFGLGEYSDKPFELKSGNSTSFKMMGSPLENKYTTTEAEGIEENVDTSKQSKINKGQGWKKALGLVGSMLTSGLDAVYGSGKVVPMSDRLLSKSKDKTKTMQEQINDINKKLKA